MTLLLFTEKVFAQDDLETYKIDEVVVTGSNEAINRNLLPYTVSKISSEEIEASGSTQLLSAISGRVPSLFVSQRNIFGFGVSSGGSGAIKIRGIGGTSSNNAILMMVDGKPQFAGIYSHPVADFYETTSIDHVEILRGPASVLYGSNAMGGVINVITKNTENEGVQTTASSQYGSHNTWLSSITNTTRFGKFSSMVSLGYDQTDGLKKDFDFKQGSVYAKIGYDLNDNWKLKADYSLMNFEGNDPIYPKLSDPTSTSIYHQNITRGEASLSASNNYDQINGNLIAYYSYGNHYIDDPRHFHSLDDRFGIMFYQNFDPWNGANATFGFDFNTYTGEIPVSGGNQHTAGSMSTIGRKSITEYSPYLTLSQVLIADKLIVNGGLRMANSDKFGSNLIPQGGFMYFPAESWTIKGSLAKGYRNPSFREMYLYKPANPDLEPEDMMNYEVTIAKKFLSVNSVDLTFYYSKGDNLIQTVSMKNVNTGHFINKGFEVSVLSQPIDPLLIHATYSYLYTTLDNLTAAPKNQYSLGADWKATDQLTVNAAIKGAGGLFVADGLDHEEYTLFNLKLTYQVLEKLNIFTTLDNITDEKYTINNGYEMPGFTIMGGFKITL